MIFGVTKTGDRVSADDGETAYCPECEDMLLPKCGDQVVHHFAHTSIASACRYRNETRWHAAFKMCWNPGCVEIERGNCRADVLKPDGTAIEFQNSPIEQHEIDRRHRVFANVVWVLNTRKLDLRLVKENRNDLAVFPGRFPLWMFRLSSRDLFDEIYFDLGDFMARKISNIARHAGASRCFVDITTRKEFVIENGGSETRFKRNEKFLKP